MRISKCSRSVELAQARGVGLRADALLDEPGLATMRSAPAELPSAEYLRLRRKLKCEGIYYPLGYPVRVVCNSGRVLECADRSWGCFEPAFNSNPLEIVVEVRCAAGSTETLPPAPAHMLQDAALVEIADADNFSIADLKRGRAIARVTPTTLASSHYLRYFFLEAMALSMIASLRAVPIHGACVRVGGKGVLLCGDSGEGKSTLAYAGARTGWTYVSDDSTYIPMDREDRLAIGNCTHMRFRPSGVALFPELAGKPITPRATGKPSIEVRTSEWPHIATANTTQVDHIVFLNRRCADTQELLPLRTSSVLPWFRQHLISPAEMRPSQEATFERLLKAGVFELRYRELGWAIDRIHELVRKGN